MLFYLKRINVNVGFNQVKMDISNQANSVYFVKVISDNGSYVVKRIVKVSKIIHKKAHWKVGFFIQIQLVWQIFLYENQSILSERNINLPPILFC